MCEFSLRAGNLLKIVSRTKTRLCCQRGNLLVTIPGDLTDYQLAQGSELLLPGNENIVIEGEATFVLADVRCPCWRLWSAWRFLKLWVTTH